MKDGKNIRAGPGGVRDYSTRVHGGTKYNRRENNKENKREIESELEKSVREDYRLS